MACLLTTVWPTDGLSADNEILLCERINAKQMPDNFSVGAVKFTGPAGDGRRGSAGFVVQTSNLNEGEGTRLSFVFQRAASGYGFQAIHPFAKGHLLVSINRGVSIHRGGSWGDIGWGNPATSDKLETTEAAAEIFPLRANTEHRVASELSAEGEYRLWINETLICLHRIERAEPLVLEVPQKKSVWAGSSWDRTPFVGADFHPNLQPGHAGLILNPDDTYRSPWLGGHGGGAETLYAANGDPIVGLYGRRGHDLDAIGFVQTPAD